MMNHQPFHLSQQSMLREVKKGMWNFSGSLLFEWLLSGSLPFALSSLGLHQIYFLEGIGGEFLNALTPGAIPENKTRTIYIDKWGQGAGRVQKRTEKLRIITLTYKVLNHFKGNKSFFKNILLILWLTK